MRIGDWSSDVCSSDLALMATLGAAMTAPKALAASPAGVVKPPRLRPGDKVGLIEPAGFTDDAFDLDLVKETIVAMGLAPKPARHLVERHGYLAGTDADRAADDNATRSEEHTTEL